MWIEIKSYYLTGFLVKYFISYKDDEKVTRLFILPLQMSVHVRNYDETKCLSFLIKDAKFLRKSWIK